MNIIYSQVENVTLNATASVALLDTDTATVACMHGLAYIQCICREYSGMFFRLITHWFVSISSRNFSLIDHNKLLSHLPLTFLAFSIFWITISFNFIYMHVYMTNCKHAKLSMLYDLILFHSYILKHVGPIF